MSQKQTLIKGTFILTLTGLLSRLMGFFYRIFLSRIFQPEEIGLYQLIFPLYTLCYAFTSIGIQTAISRTVAQKYSLHKKNDAHHTLFTGILISFSLSCLCMLILQKHATFLALHFLHNKNCIPLITAMSYTLPFSAIHSCVCGYYYGTKQTSIPSIAQLLEQSIRIISVIGLYYIFKSKLHSPSILIAVFGLVSGEIAAAIYCYTSFFTNHKRIFKNMHPFHHFVSYAKELLTTSVPLTTTRICITFLQSIEASAIPLNLQSTNCSAPQALRIYGVLTGMAMPCILFPSAVTNSIALILLPTVAELQTTHNTSNLISVICKTILTCFSLGMLCCIFFLTFGKFIGDFIFQNKMASKFIITLSWICPFIYSNTTLSSILNGLGKTIHTFFINSLGLFIRIIGIYFIIPQQGMHGYLIILLISQLCIFLLSVFQLLHVFKTQKKNPGN